MELSAVCELGKKRHRDIVETGGRDIIYIYIYLILFPVMV